MRVRADPLLATVSAFSQSISPLIFTLACGLATILASAQTVPLTATVTKITYTISADGGITLYVQNESPGADKESNWLPAPKGSFFSAMRLYWPKSAALTGQWKAPPLQRAN